MSDGFWLRVLIVLLLLVPGARADVVHLTNGSTLRGEVVSENAESVVLRTPRSLLTIPAADVAGIERETEADGLRGLGENCLRHHRYARALEYLEGGTLKKEYLIPCPPITKENAHKFKGQF